MSGGPIVVTGGAGFIGSNLVDRLASQGHEVVVLDALSRPGVERNLAWLEQRHPRRIRSVVADIRDRRAVGKVIDGAAAVFHLAAQVAVTTSMVDPIEDFETNVAGAINVLEAARRQRGETPVIFASTNKVYGDLADVRLTLADGAYAPADPAFLRHGVGEDRPLDFHTPYGCSKGAADQYMLDYARSFDLPTCVLRMSCIYGPRQMGTEDQGWVAHFLIRALAGEPITLYGDGRQVRDVLFVDDAVDAYVAALERIQAIKGQAFNLGGGPRNAVSLLELIGHMETLLGRPVETRFEDWRPGDQRYYVSDARSVRTVLGLAPPVGWRDGVARLAAWLEQERAAPQVRRVEAVS
jgi:CDP-paratose 2-epimerase